MCIGDFFSQLGDTRLGGSNWEDIRSVSPPTANLLREDKEEDLLTPPG